MRAPGIKHDIYAPPPPHIEENTIRGEGGAEAFIFGSKTKKKENDVLVFGLKSDIAAVRD